MGSEMCIRDRWWSDGKLVRKETGLSAQDGSLHSWSSENTSTAQWVFLFLLLWPSEKIHFVLAFHTGTIGVGHIYTGTIGVG